jgi:hypothetical protein
MQRKENSVSSSVIYPVWTALPKEECSLAQKVKHNVCIFRSIKPRTVQIRKISICLSTASLTQLRGQRAAISAKHRKEKTVSYLAQPKKERSASYLAQHMKERAPVFPCPAQERKNSVLSSPALAYPVVAKTSITVLSNL